ncbi:MAG TPA: hypothetical protein VGF45_17775 [Polyangia bacterium]
MASRILQIASAVALLAACASTEGRDEQPPGARAGRAGTTGCPAPELISENEREALRTAAVTISEGEGHRLVCGGGLTAPHWINLPVEGAAKVCVDPRGVVYDVTTERTTGDPTFDKMLRIEMRSWRHVPLLREGKPTAFCYPLTVRLDESNQR